MIRSLLTLLNNTSDEIRSTFVAVFLSTGSGVRGDGAPELAEPMLQVLGVISRAATDTLSYPRPSEHAELTLWVRERGVILRGGTTGLSSPCGEVGGVEKCSLVNESFKESWCDVASCFCCSEIFIVAAISPAFVLTSLTLTYITKS